MSERIEKPKRITLKQFHKLLRPMGENYEPVTRQTSKVSRKYLQCPQDFKKSMISHIAKQLESWFSSGVVYRDEVSMLAPGHPYANMPEALDVTLRQAHWLITFQLLKQNGVPCKAWPSVLMLFPAYKKFENETEDYSDRIRPILGIKTTHMPAPFIWNTRDIPSRPRAEKVALDWFELTEISWGEFITQALAQEKGAYLDRSISAVNKRVEVEQILARLGYDYFDIMQYYMRKQGFYYRDISGILEEFGIKRSEEAVRKSCKRQEMKVDKETE